MSGDKKQPFNSQTKELVHGFMNLWTKFGAILPSELANIRENLKGISPTSELHPDSNYELFFRVTSVIMNKENPTMGELSSALSIPLSTATRIVDWMVDRGYAERLSDTEDRRVVRVTLTEYGKQLNRTIESYIIERVQKIMSGLTEEERLKVFSHIYEIAAIIRKAM